MTYSDLKQQQHDEINSFPMFFAFNDQQFQEGKQRLNVTEKSQLLQFMGGGFIRRSDQQPFLALHARLKTELETAMQEREFLIDALTCELANHEYCYTLDPQATFEALNFTLDTDFKKECFLLARQKVIEYDY